MPSPSAAAATAPAQHGLKRELGLTDLVLAQILFLVGLTNFGNSAKLGPSHVVFWLAAIVLFYIPQAMVVIHLNSWRPLEGGVYQWVRSAFGEFAGFLIAWNLWIYAMFLMSEIGLTMVTNLAYAIGPSAIWIAESNAIVGAATVGLVILLAWVSIAGLSVGKWIYNLGGVAVLVLLTALMAVQFLPHTRPTMSLAMPPLTLVNLSILGKLAFFALGGFEYMAVFAGECKDPEKMIGRSVLISAPIIAALFIFGTSAVLSVVDAKDVDLVSPVLQAISIASRPMKLAAHLASAFFTLLLISRLAQSSINFGVNSRLPMVAGWDHLLPEWFTRLHPTRRTPVNSTMFVAAMILVFAFWGMSGTGRQEAFQLLSNAMGIFYGIAYLAMFAIPILGFASAPMYMRLAAVSGFGMTFLCVVLAVFPIIPVPNPLLFALKLCGAVVGANALGGFIYWIQTRRPALPRAIA
ncbi:MAG TPA: APC family permease [Bryobacteraceae bacterium]